MSTMTKAQTAQSGGGDGGQATHMREQAAILIDSLPGPKVIRRVRIDTLHQDPANVNRHPDNNLRAIRDSIKTFGQVEPLVVQKGTGKVIGGNGRLEVLARDGATEVDVVELDIDDTKAAALGIALNRTAKTSEFDDASLAAVLATLPTELQLGAGFDESELRALDATLDKPVVEDEAPAPLPEPVSKRGDIWTLGGHRLMCGDSTDGGDVALVMDGERADLCFTSPPYALGKSVALSGNTRMSANANPYGEHDDNTDGWESLMRQWFAASDTAVSDVWVVNVQPLAGNKRHLMRFVAENADRLVDIATWDKGHAAPAMAAGVMSSRYEWMIIFSSAVGASRAVPLSSWRGTVESVYEGPPQRENPCPEIHAATMPIHVPVWVIQTLCDKCASVYEPFSGSGTTIIACEQLGRRCYAIEIEPRYVDVAIRRWQKLTGKAATLDGKAWADVAAERGVKVDA